MPRFKGFLEGIDDAESALGKAVEKVKGGVSMAQDIADKYNSIAEWCGMPVVPKLFLKKDK